MSQVDLTAVPVAAAERLTLRIVGILATHSAVLHRMARALAHRARSVALAESIERRRRRTLHDPQLDPVICYRPVVAQVVDGPGRHAAHQAVGLIVDERRTTDQVPLRRISLADGGGRLPWAWAGWEQHVAMPDGQYWGEMDRVLAAVAALVPPGVPVVGLADRAYAGPAFRDRLDADGWWWIVRVTTTRRHRRRDQLGQEHARKAVGAARLARPGQRFRLRGELCKDAGWRPVNLLGLRGHGRTDPLVVVTNRAPHWAVMRLSERRFWIEAGCRGDKSKGGQWEASQVQGVAHHPRLLRGLAWATLIAWCLGAAEADARWTRLATAPVPLRARPARPGLPRHARASIVTLGLDAIGGWLVQPIMRPWRGWLPDLAAPSWHDQWYRLQAQRFLAASPVRP